ncbi:hypothetical protein [Photobacterium damselae]|uniref:hypothetical protein n=1 Tax=Photobacterium damselae TaxID=38293 RepID=UPI001CB6F48A|nr:hypothetical protein [Photobacterium damselae]
MAFPQDIVSMIKRAMDVESASSSALGQNESLCPRCNQSHSQQQPAITDINAIVGAGASQEEKQADAAQKLAEEEAKAFSGGDASPEQTEPQPETGNARKTQETTIGDKSKKLAESEEEAFDNQVVGDAAMKQAEAAVKQEEANHLKAKTKSLETDNDIKKWIAEKTFNFMAWWCGFVALMVFMYFGSKKGNVEKEVIIALMGTTTISVVGLVGFIVKGLFGSKDEKESEKSKDKK